MLHVIVMHVSYRERILSLKSDVVRRWAMGEKTDIGVEFVLSTC